MARIPWLTAHHGAHCVIHHSNNINAVAWATERGQRLGSPGDGWLGPWIYGDIRSPKGVSTCPTHLCHVCWRPLPPYKGFSSSYSLSVLILLCLRSWSSRGSQPQPLLLEPQCSSQDQTRVSISPLKAARCTHLTCFFFCPGPSLLPKPALSVLVSSYSHSTHGGGVQWIQSSLSSHLRLLKMPFTEIRASPQPQLMHLQASPSGPAQATVHPSLCSQSSESPSQQGQSY